MHTPSPPPFFSSTFFVFHLPGPLFPLPFSPHAPSKPLPYPQPLGLHPGPTQPATLLSLSLLLLHPSSTIFIQPSSDNIYVNQLINNLNQIIMNQLTQKILFATSLIIFVVTIAALVTWNATRYGTDICLGF